MLSHVQAQTSEKWLGLHNFDLKSEGESIWESLRFGESGYIKVEVDNTSFTQSASVHLRFVKPSNRYHQIDIVSAEWTEGSQRFVFTDTMGTRHVLRDLSTKAYRYSAGYGFGKLIPLFKSLSADLGFRGSISYGRETERPQTEFNFPESTTSSAGSINATGGLVYRFRDKFIFGYHCNLFRLQGAILTSRSERPDLPPQALEFTQFDVEGYILEDMISFGRLSFSFILGAGEE